MFKAAFVIFAAAIPCILGTKQGTACTGTISSLDDVDDAVECTTVNINSFTVPAGETFNLDLADGTTVNMGMLFFPASTYTHATPPASLRGGCQFWQQDVGWSAIPSQVRILSALIVIRDDSSS